MAGDLLERRDELDALRRAVSDTRAGRGRVVLVTGEAGIGKTSLIRAGIGRPGPEVRLLSGACDDLLAPRALGPLRDAARGTGGPLERALTSAPEAVFGAAVEELSAARPTVLVVEDVHWADDATLDVLSHLARRIHTLPAAVVLSVRDEAVTTSHPVRQLLGALAGADTVRLPLAPLSRGAVAALAEAAGRDGSALHAATGGNPFYVTETLAAPPDAMPASVTDAVLARLRRLGPGCVTALEQLSVVPNLVDFPLVDALLGEQLEDLADAEEHGIIETRADGLAFRHELARRALEMTLPRLRRRALHRAVVRALRNTTSPDKERLVHHAVQADDAATVIEFAPGAGREARAAGSHRQALAQFDAALPYADRLPPVEQARLVADHSWELYIAHRFREAVIGAREAARRFEELGELGALGETLLMLSRCVFMSGESDEAEEAVRRAVDVLGGAGSAAALAAAVTHHGAMLTLTGRMSEAVTALLEARELAGGVGRPDLESLCLNYLGLARAERGDYPAGERDLRAALAIATANGCHEAAARGYINLGELLYGRGDWAGFAETVDAGMAFADEHGLWQHTFLLDLQRHMLLVHRGEWDAAERGLRALMGQNDEPSMFDPAALATHGRLLARLGRPEAGELLDRAWRRARRQRAPLGLVRSGLAVVEWAWLTGSPDRAREVAEVLVPYMRSGGWAYLRGDLARFLTRAGVDAAELDVAELDVAELDVAGVDVGPEDRADVWTLGIGGDWAAAAEAWELAGDPYLRALELADSGAVEPTLEALRVLDSLGAAPAAALVRRRLRDLGLTNVPRGPRRSTSANPAGLTDRQLEVLDLLDDGATNAEIAARLVVSVRTVDHHVAAVLAKLGARTRREAVAAARVLRAASPPALSETGQAVRHPDEMTTQRSAP